MPRQRELIAEFIRERNVFLNDDSRVIIGEVSELTGELDETQADADAVVSVPSGANDHGNGDDFGLLLDSDPVAIQAIPKIITIKGEAEQGQLKPGLTYRFYGHPYTHHKYGEQFIFAAFTVETPATEDAVVAYLCQCKGIGPGIARRLWDQYGSNAIAALRLQPERCAEEVKGLRPETAQAAAEFLHQFESVERVKTDLLGLLSGRGFPKKTIETAIQRWGSDAAAVVRRCPYYLMAFRGCGFLKTDKMYLELGLPPAKLKRQALCAWHAIARDGEGHTWYPLSVAAGAIARRISGGQLRADKATELAIRGGLLSTRDFSGCQWVAEEKKATAEERCALNIDVAFDEKSEWPNVDTLAEQGLSEHQLQELGKALAGVIGLLTGSPGTGKTHTAAAVIREIARVCGDAAIAAAAPTGKAAVRLTEALQANGIEIPAITIHRLLQVQSSADGWTFLYNSGNPLPFRFVLIDESSMIDTSLMASLLDARAPGTHYLFLGDPNQLAPVGHGAPLRDMITAGVPCGELREIRRNSGRIVQACADIRDSRRFIPSPGGKADLANGENLLHVETNGAEQSIAMLQKFIESTKASGKYDPVWGVQVLCAVNKKSALGRKPLNELLQGMLNPAGEKASGNKFRRGDKIINLKNGWFPSLDPEHPEANDDGKVFVANGEIGEAITVEPARTICRLSSPDRVCVILHGKAAAKAGADADGSGDEDDSQGPNRKDDDNEEDTGTGSTWDLAYAISTHKSQGSEFPVTVIMIDEHNGAQRLCTRNWIYTAISRAKKLCITIGPQRLANQMCQKDGLKRRTFLVERLQELRPTPEPIQIAITDDQFSELFSMAGA